MKAGFRLPIAIGVIARVNDGPDMLGRLVTHVIELEQVAGRFDVHTPYVFEVALRYAVLVCGNHFIPGQSVNYAES